MYIKNDSNQKVTLDINSAAIFIAQLVREGVTFEAYQKGEGKYAEVVVVFTGGF